MKYKIAWYEKKNEDWAIVSLESGEKDVSINRKSKKGEIFPNFDDIRPGSEVEGELWQSPAGKWYLFPPRPQTTPSGANKGQGGAFKAKQIEKAQERTHQHVLEAQDRKEESIKLSACQRDAVLLTIAMFGDRLNADEVLSESDIKSIMKKAVIEWRDWLLNSKEFNDVLPFE